MDKMKKMKQKHDENVLKMRMKWKIQNIYKNGKVHAKPDENEHTTSVYQDDVAVSSEGSSKINFY